MIMVCERCAVEIETVVASSRNPATLGLNLDGLVRFREGQYAVRTERIKPFWLCLKCHKEFQRWLANKDKK